MLSAGTRLSQMQRLPIWVRARIHICLCLCSLSAHALAAEMLQNAKKEASSCCSEKQRHKPGSHTLFSVAFLTGLSTMTRPYFLRCSKSVLKTEQLLVFLAPPGLYLCVPHPRVCLLLRRTGEPWDTDPPFMGYACDKSSGELKCFSTMLKAMCQH